MRHLNLEFISSVEEWLNNSNDLCCINMNLYGTIQESNQLQKIYNSRMSVWIDGKIFHRIYCRKYKIQTDHRRGFNVLEKLIAIKGIENLVFIGPDFQEKGLKKINPNIKFISLPYVSSADNFDYHSISRELHQYEESIVVISLGAPKQEFFLGKIREYCPSKKYVSIGAAVNYLVKKDAFAEFFSYFYMEWLYRLITEFSKTSKRLSKELKVLWTLISQR